MVVYSSLPVMGTTANIICITRHLSVPYPAELLLKHHLCLKIIFHALAASVLNLAFVKWFEVGKIWCYNTSQP